MDNAIEQVKILSQICDLHLVIELSTDSLKSTIIDFSNCDLKPGVHPLLSILDTATNEKLYPYFKQLKSLNYAFYPSKKMIGIINITTIHKLLVILKSNNIQFIHFDTTSGRFLPAIPFVANYKIFATIHDPIPHIGENDFKKKFVNYIYRLVIYKYLFYSKYAATQFLSVYPRFSTQVFVAKLLPYGYIRNFNSILKTETNYILYFGRVSYYKGIDILLNALDIVWLNYPDLKVIIAGKSHGNYQFDRQLSIRNTNITYLPDYITIEKLHALIKQSLFVVCPYREATQSGVLMTALAMNKPVLATNVGAFSEYIQPEKNGLLSAPDEHSLAKAIKSLLYDRHYMQIEQEMHLSNSSKEISFNLEEYKKMYDINQ